MTINYQVRQSSPAHTAGSDHTFSTHSDREAALLAAQALTAKHEGVYVEERLYADYLQIKQDKPFDTGIIWADWL